LNELRSLPAENATVMRKIAEERGRRDLSNLTKYMIERYDEKIKSYDEYVGNLLNELEKAGILRRSVVVITSDHGEGFGEHGIFFEHAHLYDEMLWVPLIIKFPINKYQGIRIKQQVRHVDIVPTILDFLGMKDFEMQGESLIPLIEGRKIINFTYLGWRWLAGVRTENWKYIYNNNTGEEELYNLQNDKEEMKNLAKEMPEKTKEYREMLFTFKNTTKKYTATELNKVKIEEMLKSLGYNK
jgi:arylsulfatase A-like enzyme